MEKIILSKPDGDPVLIHNRDDGTEDRGRAAQLFRGGGMTGGPSSLGLHLPQTLLIGIMDADSIGSLMRLASFTEFGLRAILDQPVRAALTDLALPPLERMIPA